MRSLSLVKLGAVISVSNVQCYDLEADSERHFRNGWVPWSDLSPALGYLVGVVLHNQALNTAAAVPAVFLTKFFIPP